LTLFDRLNQTVTSDVSLSLERVIMPGPLLMPALNQGSISYFIVILTQLLGLFNIETLL